MSFRFLSNSNDYIKLRLFAFVHKKANSRKKMSKRIVNQLYQRLFERLEDEEPPICNVPDDCEYPVEETLLEPRPR